jgi:pyruvate-ferredoxin/flavodoxin oxidoreductase
MKCPVICPHAAIRPFLITQAEEDVAPAGFQTQKAKGGVELSGLKFRIQVTEFIRA